MTQYTFYREATTTIRFPSDRQFAEYRDDMTDRYQQSMVRVSRSQVRPDGSVFAEVRHSSNLGAEIRGRAVGHYDGSTINTIYNEKD